MKPIKCCRVSIGCCLGLVLGLFLLGYPFSVLGQVGSGVISGTVKDPSGAVIPQATVTITQTDTGLQRSLTTDAQGYYRAVSLPPGSYNVKAERQGFRVVERTGITLVVGSSVVVDLNMEVGAVTQSVTVAGEAPLVRSESTEISTTIPKDYIANLPVIGRRWDNFVFMSPGVTPDGTFGLISYRGISGLYNNNMIDGVDNNQAFFSEARGRTRLAYTYSEAAVEEFQVGISNYSAEYGRAAGGTVNAVTKSGGNTMHGQAFYYIRDSSFEAREPTIPTAPLIRAIGTDKPQERRQQFGAAAGGPIKRDKLFWFGSYDQQKRGFPFFVNPSNPAFYSGTGQFACTAPAANCAAVLSYMQAHTTLGPREANNWVAMGRLDWVINEKHSLSGYYNWHKWHTPNGIQSGAVINIDPSNQGSDDVRTDVIWVRQTTVVSPTKVNEVRFQYGRDLEFEVPNGQGPYTNITNGINFGMPNYLPRPAYPDEKRLEWIDNFTWVRGQHSVKFGADINYIRDRQINLFNGGSGYSYTNLSNIALDCLVGAGSGCVPSGTPLGKHYSSFTQAIDLRAVAGSLPGSQAGSLLFTDIDWNFFVQDIWKIRPDLTLDYGLRYEYQQLPQPPQGNPAFPLTQHINQDKRDWAPRVGLVWDVGAHHTTTVRAGFGVYYGRTSNSAIANAFLNNAVTTVSYTFTPSTSGSPAYPNCFTPATNSPCTLPAPTGPGGTPDINEFSPDYARPMIYQGDFSIEHEIFHDTLFRATYAWSGGRRLPNFRDVNLPAPGARVFYNVTGPLTDYTGETQFASSGVLGPFPFYSCATFAAGSCPASARPNASVRQIIMSESNLNSNYNALILEVNRRMHRGVMFNSSFTWSKALDNGQSSQTFFGSFSFAFDPLNQKAEYGVSSYNIPARFVTGFVWKPDETWNFGSGAKHKLLGNWLFSGGVVLQNGIPLNGSINGSLSATGTQPIITTSPNGSNGSNRAPFFSRNHFRGPSFKDVDFRISRSFPLGESRRVEIIAEAFNLFNRTNFATFSTSSAYVLGSNVIAGSAATCGGVAVNPTDRCITLTPGNGFLAPNSASSTYTGPRQFQFAAKFWW